VTRSAAALAQDPVGLEKLETFVEGLDHPEGIAIAPEGTVFAGGESGQIYAIDAGGTLKEIANTGGFALGIALDGDGRLYVCDDGRSSVLRVERSTGEVEEFASGLGGRSMHTPNWPAFDERGNLYVSDSGGWNAADGLIWVIRPGRRLEIFSDEAVDFPNGLAVSPDGSRLYVAESTPGKLVEIPINDDGSAGPRRVLCELGLVVPDGVAVAGDGSIVVACYRPDAILRWSAGDGIDVLASDPQGTVLNAPTNIAFTGDELDVAILPNLGGWHLVRGRLGVRGTPLTRPSADLIAA
jgi:gluconolactonase